MDKNQIERLASNKAVYGQGARIYRDSGVGELSFDASGSGAVALARLADGDVMVSVWFDEGGLLRRFSCSCDAFGVWRGGCAHVVAALLAIFENNRRAATISRQARVASHLLETFEKRTFERIDKELAKENAPANPIMLRPAFCLDDDNTPGIRLEIGRGRMYVVKDIYTLIHAFNNEAVLSYGKNSEIAHKTHLLDHASKKLLELLTHDNDRMYRSIGKIYHMTPMGMDRFFALYAGERIDADKELGAGELFLDPMPPEGVVDWQNRALCQRYEGLRAFPGDAFGYVLHAGSLHRVSLDYLSVITALGRAFSTAGARLAFEEADEPRISAFLLPELVRHGILHIDEQTDAMPQKLAPRAYLDAEGGVVSCRIAFVYDGVETDADSRVLRDYAGEYAFVKNLELMGFSGDGRILSLEGDDGIHAFYYGENGLGRLRELAEVFATDAFTNASRKPVKTPSFGLRINGALLEIGISGDYSPAELLAALESYRLKKTYHRLPDGRYVDFGDRDFFDRMDALFTGLDVKPKDIGRDTLTVPGYRALHTAARLADGDCEVTLDEGATRLLADFSGHSDQTRDFAPPDALAGILRPYQQEGYRWLMTLSRYGFGGILADDMGLGKTLQVIAALLAYKEGGGGLPSMVVAPTSLIYNWEKEIGRFAPMLRTTILSGTAAKRREDFNPNGGADVFITTYDMLKRDIENYQDADFRYVVADEAQNMKNPGTQNARAVKRLKGEVRLALTGTPIENSLAELWSIFDYVMPGFLFGQTRFTKTYESPIIKDKCENAAAALRRQISPFILRRLKSDVLTELPDKVETTLYADMTAEQKRLYDAYLLKTKGELAEYLGDFNNRRIEILSMLTRLRQICCHPATFIEDYTGGSGKLDLTMETLLSALESGHRVLIFSQFTRMLSILTERLDDKKIPYFYLDGATPSKERLEMTETFNKGGSKDVFLISLKAGGAGLNLTGADLVIHYDPWWNPAVMAQASDRAHRFGQTRVVQVLNIVSKDTIEEKILTLQNLKKDMIDTIIKEGTNFITQLSRDEIMELFAVD